MRVTAFQGAESPIQAVGRSLAEDQGALSGVVFELHVAQAFQLGPEIRKTILVTAAGFDTIGHS